MNKNEVVADYLNKSEAALVNEWELRARSEIEAATENSSLVLRDHFFKLLEDLAFLLRTSSHNGRDMDADGINESITQFEKHGRERATVKNYDEDQLLWEAVLLRRIIIDDLFDHALADPVIIEKITRYFESFSWATLSSFSESMRATHKKIIASLVHDIRNPLHAIQSTFELLDRKLKTEETEKLFENIEISTHRIISILNEVLDAGNIEAGKGLVLRFEENDFLKDLDIIRREALSVYGSRFQANFEVPDGELKAVLDSAILTRLLENLISNAFKHGNPDGNVTLTVKDQDNRIFISVHNTGDPIPLEKQERIFEYLSTSKGGSSDGKGWGIGLALARATAEGHRGTIELKSIQEKGTTFSLMIPKNAREPGETATLFV